MKESVVNPEITQESIGRFDQSRSKRALSKYFFLPLLLFIATLISNSTARAAQLNARSYDTPTPTNGVFSITNGPDGNIWFAKTAENQIGKVTMDGVITEYDVSQGSGIYMITPGPDGNMWFTIGSGQVCKSTTLGVITCYDVSSYVGSTSPYAITPGPDGNMWVTTADLSGNVDSGFILKITTSGSITDYPITRGSLGITPGPDGNMWFTGLSESPDSTNYLGKITTDGVVTEYPLPDIGDGTTFLTVGPDYNIWYLRNPLDDGKVGKITTDGVVTEYDLPSGAFAFYGITLGPDDNIWFAESGLNRLASITPDGEIVEYDLPANTGPISLVLGPDGYIWFSTQSGIGRIIEDEVEQSPVSCQSNCSTPTISVTPSTTTRQPSSGPETNPEVVLGEEVETPLPHVALAENFGSSTKTKVDDQVGLMNRLINRLASILNVEPITVARILPWAVILSLLGLILIVLLNLIKQLIIVAKMKKLVRRQELLNLEKTWLLSLSSHYLKTPLTIIQSGQEMLKEGQDKDVLVKGMSQLNVVVAGVIDRLRKDSVVAEMEPPEEMHYRHASFWQSKVIVPVFVTLGLVLALNILFVFGANLYPGTAHIIRQVCAVAIAAGVLYLVYDTWYEKRALEDYQNQLLEYEEGLDKVRNKFVLSMAHELMPEIEKAKSFVAKEVPLEAKKNIDKGLGQLEKTTEKFLLIYQLEKEELRKQASTLGLRGTIERAKEQSRHPKSPVSLMMAEDSTLSQPEILLKKVFASLMDNAAEHSDSKKPVEIHSKEGRMVKVSVQDFGKGIEEEKLALLFKPLSKVEEDFTSQGMGLSLYLNRLIMHYLNGEIRATSKVGAGTKMTVEIPKSLS